MRRFFPGADLVNVEDGGFTLTGVDPDDDHFKRHMDAFTAGRSLDCKDLVCVVHAVHDL